MCMVLLLSIGQLVDFLRNETVQIEAVGDLSQVLLVEGFGVDLEDLVGEFSYVLDFECEFHFIILTEASLVSSQYLELLLVLESGGCVLSELSLVLVQRSSLQHSVGNIQVDQEVDVEEAFQLLDHAVHIDQVLQVALEDCVQVWVRDVHWLVSDQVFPT